VVWLVGKARSRCELISHGGQKNRLLQTEIWSSLIENFMSKPGKFPGPLVASNYSEGGFAGSRPARVDSCMYRVGSISSGTPDTWASAQACMTTPPE